MDKKNILFCHSDSTLPANVHPRAPGDFAIHRYDSFCGQKKKKHSLTMVTPGCLQMSPQGPRRLHGRVKVARVQSVWGFPTTGFQELMKPWRSVLRQWGLSGRGAGWGWGYTAKQRHVTCPLHLHNSESEVHCTCHIQRLNIFQDQLEVTGKPNIRGGGGVRSEPKIKAYN